MSHLKLNSFSSLNFLGEKVNYLWGPTCDLGSANISNLNSYHCLLSVSNMPSFPYLKACLLAVVLFWNAPITFLCVWLFLVIQVLIQMLPLIQGLPFQESLPWTTQSFSDFHDSLLFYCILSNLFIDISLYFI